MKHCGPSYKHWYRQAVTCTPANNTSQKQADTAKATPTTSQAHIHLQAHWPQRSPLAVHVGLPLCAHSSQLHCVTTQNHHAPPLVLAHLRWCHLTTCPIGLKVPHTRPTVRLRPSMANCCAGLSKAPQPTPQLRHMPRRTNTTKQSTRTTHN